MQCFCFLPHCTICGSGDLGEQYQYQCQCFLPSCKQCGIGKDNSKKRARNDSPDGESKTADGGSKTVASRLQEGPRELGLDFWAAWAVGQCVATDDPVLGGAGSSRLNKQETWMIGSVCTGIGTCYMVAQALSKSSAQSQSLGLNFGHVFQCEINDRKRSYLLASLGF